MGTFTIFCTLLLVSARTWILGRVMCVTNFLMFATSNFLFIILYLIISRDKYIVARDSLFTRPSKKRAYVLSVVAWGIPLGVVLAGVWYPVTTILSPTTSVVNGNFACYGFGSSRTRDRTTLVIVTVIFLSFMLSMVISTLVSLYNFVRILLELRRLNKLRARLSLPRNRANCPNDDQDRPLYITAEENTAKSLALVFFIQFLSLSIGYTMSYIQVIRVFVSPLESRGDHLDQILFIIILIAQLFPATNPVYLILSNKRLRKRVRGLLKCEFKPDLGNSQPDSILARKGTLRLLNFRARSKVYPQSI